ncbi:hypothetical protein B5F53_11665 [Blautia sp. An249]|uniref:hypothetical protein n=1 Tax=Blautia sp. An249 TaxID=1965603 RepID=UPI000B392F73|nr:hypothetical protein [Blautia sp. An249]OUO78198.1 hypothetical protein B5F53_11665 [Blautia sp. An249]
MKYREFVKWCNERACDGCWGMLEAMICIWVLEEVRKAPFWRREKVWREQYENDVVNQIVEPTNQKIKELCGMRNGGKR